MLIKAALRNIKGHFFPKQSLLLLKTKFTMCLIPQSKHYRPRTSVTDFFNQHNLQYLTSRSGFRIKYCPFCPKPHYDDPSNLHVLHVDRQTGIWHCFRCNAKGSWMQFKKNVLGIKDDSFSAEYSFKNQSQQHIPGQDAGKISQVQFFRYFQNLKSNINYQYVKKYILNRRISEQTIEKYCVGAQFQDFVNQDGHVIRLESILFPQFRMRSKKQIKIYERQKVQQISKKLQEQQSSEIGKTSSFQTQNRKQSFTGSDYVQICKIKVRAAGDQNKSFMRQKPRGANSGFFGLNTIKFSDERVVITQGQFDAMAVYEATGMPTLSLPNGAHSLPDYMIPALDQFKQIYLWMDNDQAGRASQQKLAHKLGLGRTFLVRSSCYKDANQALRDNPDAIKELLGKAKTIPSQNIINFSEMREAIRNKIERYDQEIGYQLEWFKSFNKKVKGIRKSELTIVSGPTGSGKTTFVSQVTVQLAKKGLPILWGSFEITNVNLATNMLTQFAQKNLVKSKAKFDYYADMYEQLPIHYLSFHGSTQVKKVLGTIQYAIQKLNIELLVIDTLQFLLSEQAEGYQKFELQDSVIARLRKMATEFKIHVIVVIHPRKTQDNEDIGVHSIYGTSKATQQADNIWIIQNRQNFKIFDVKKNRFDGQLGKFALGYNKNSKRFLQLHRAQLESLMQKQKTMVEIISARQTSQEQGSHEHDIDSSDPLLDKVNRIKNKLRK